MDKNKTDVRLDKSYSAIVLSAIDQINRITKQANEAISQLTEGVEKIKSMLVSLHGLEGSEHEFYVIEEGVLGLRAKTTVEGE